MIHIQISESLVLHNIHDLTAHVVRTTFHTMRIGADFAAHAGAPVATGQNATAATIAGEL